MEIFYYEMTRCAMDDLNLDASREVSREAFHRLLKMVHHFRRYARQMKGQGISPRDYSVLRYLLESGPATVGEVQAYLHRSPSTASTLIARLEEAGYVTRTRSTADNRVVIVALTRAGKDIVERTPLGGLPLLRRRLDILPMDRLLFINEALGEIIQLLEVTDSE
jgi:DNA-binding MarR family transcriptional regulator